MREDLPQMSDRKRCSPRASPITTLAIFWRFSGLARDASLGIDILRLHLRTLCNGRFTKWSTFLLPKDCKRTTNFVRERRRNSHRCLALGPATLLRGWSITCNCHASGIWTSRSLYGPSFLPNDVDRKPRFADPHVLDAAVFQNQGYFPSLSCFFRSSLKNSNLLLRVSIFICSRLEGQSRYGTRGACNLQFGR